MHTRQMIVIPDRNYDKCDKPAVDRRKYCELCCSMTDHFITLTAHRCRAKLTTRCDDRRAMYGTIFKSRVYDKVLK